MDWDIIHIDETDSTNCWLRQHASEKGGSGARWGRVVVAEHQTAGRGCGSNTWESERGSNLTFSALIHPHGVPAANQFILSMANALALKAALDEYVENVTIKWPNDIYWQDKKICGTLIETTLRGSDIADCIFGTGINVNQQLFVSNAPNPVSLCQILGREVDREELLNKVLNHFAGFLAMLEQGEWERIRTSYRRQLYRLGQPHYYQIGPRRECCRLESVTDDGHLQLLRLSDDGCDDELLSFAFKEVQFIL